MTSNPLQTALEDQLHLAHLELERLRDAGRRLERNLRQITGEPGQWPADREVDEALAGWQDATADPRQRRRREGE